MKNEAIALDRPADIAVRLVKFLCEAGGEADGKCGDGLRLRGTAGESRWVRSLGRGQNRAFSDVAVRDRRDTGSAR